MLNVVLTTVPTELAEVHQRIDVYAKGGRWKVWLAAIHFVTSRALDSLSMVPLEGG